MCWRNIMLNSQQPSLLQFTNVRTLVPLHARRHAAPTQRHNDTTGEHFCAHQQLCQEKLLPHLSAALNLKLQEKALAEIRAHNIFEYEEGVVLRGHGSIFAANVGAKCRCNGCISWNTGYWFRHINACRSCIEAAFEQKQVSIYLILGDFGPFSFSHIKLLFLPNCFLFLFFC